MTNFLSLTPAELASIPAETRAKLQQRALDFLRDLGVTPLVGRGGQLGVNLANLAPALGFTMGGARERLDEARMQGTIRGDRAPLQ